MMLPLRIRRLFFAGVLSLYAQICSAQDPARSVSLHALSPEARLERELETCEVTTMAYAAVGSRNPQVAVLEQFLREYNLHQRHLLSCPDPLTDFEAAPSWRCSLARELSFCLFNRSVVYRRILRNHSAQISQLQDPAKNPESPALHPVPSATRGRILQQDAIAIPSN